MEFKKIQKVAVSTLSAEAMSMASAVDCLAWVRLYWAWLRNVKTEWRLGDKTLKELPAAIAAIREDPSDDPTSLVESLKIAQENNETQNNSILSTDCKSLFDLVSRTAAPSCQEFRTLLQAKLIKEHLETGITVRWVPTGAQMADCLTKIMDCSVLRACLKLGRYCLQDEDQLLKTRADARTRLKWLQENACKGKSQDVPEFIENTS